MDSTVGGTSVKPRRSVYVHHSVQSVLLHLFKHRGVTMLTGFPRTRWPRRRFIESSAARISAKISRICEFHIIMGIMTGLLGCCSSNTFGSRANDFVKTLATLGFWLHHSPCSLAARLLSPNPYWDQSKSMFIKVAPGMDWWWFCSLITSHITCKTWCYTHDRTTCIADQNFFTTVCYLQMYFGHQQAQCWLHCWT